MKAHPAPSPALQIGDLPIGGSSTAGLVESPARVQGIPRICQKYTSDPRICITLNFYLKEILTDRRICQRKQGFANDVHAGQRSHEDQ